MLTEKWEETLWAELRELNARERFVATGELIPYLSKVLLNLLSEQRRLAVLESVEEENIDATTFAELVGSRPSTIRRLLEEARALKRLGVSSIAEPVS